jgi:hypothetical protein
MAPGNPRPTLNRIHGQQDSIRVFVFIVIIITITIVVIVVDPNDLKRQVK